MSSGGACGAHCAYRSASHATTRAALEKHYAIDAAQLPAAARGALVRLELDAETRAFLDSCGAHGCADALAACLRPLLAVTDVNGLLCRGGMFVLSRAAAGALLAAPLRAAAARRARGGGGAALLDVGAGDGDVTARLAPLFCRVEATEVSWPMVARLTARGFRARRTGSLAALPAGAYDVVSLLNLLDRADAPLALLCDAARLVRPGGRVLVALVLPFGEFVEDGARRRAPRAPLEGMRGARCGDGASFEASLAAFVERVLPRAGLAVEALARAPYLCRGDARRPFYVLSDAILVLRRADEAAAGGGGEGESGPPREPPLAEDCDALLSVPSAATISFRA
jgi:SAM-dependent methyltransferase